MIYEFEIAPMGKPRMTRQGRFSDRAKKYFKWAEDLRVLSLFKKYELKDTLNVYFEIQMPDSWPKKKKKEYEGKPHRQRPDIDNLIKAFLDALSSEDKFVWSISASKIWASNNPRIIVVE